jgi:hypothetical protein
VATQDYVSLRPQVQEAPQPWWAEGWYRPGVALVLVASGMFAVAPWLGDNCGKVCGTGLAVVLVGALLTIMYALKSEDYDSREKALDKARSEALHGWHQEQQYEHCKDHCSCGACREVRVVHATAIKAAE